MKHHTLIGTEDHARIAEAIRKAEAETSGEIYAVLARSSDDYFFAAGFVATCGILLASIVVAFLAHWYWFDVRLPMFGLAVLAAFLTAMLVLWVFPAIRMLLVPRRIRYKRAHLNALQQFLARNVHITEHRTGILLFVSMAEHYAEVIADAGINARVGQDEWNAIVATLIHHASRAQVAEGFVLAIGQAGLLLETHFPAGADNVNELDDHLIEL
ncbi:TPM domain-containing protein [Brucella intermedia]|uniref:TPM domain-containing protein n=1 Tax=Brucella intermedia TaxID=94625 RepID=A0A7V6U2C1_9HYPH|nr:TPM domain-containing protein [Brucella intermedia]WGG59273.1 TPM domain-containing protein [Brucella intermedia]HHV70950.1 TPM domain-containing protein [Brucella intermedia]